MNFIEKTIAKKVITNLSKNLPKIEQTILEKIPNLAEKYILKEDENPVIIIIPMKDQATGKMRLTAFLMAQEKDQPEAQLEYLAGPYIAEHLLELLEGMDIDNLNINL